MWLSYYKLQFGIWNPLQSVKGFAKRQLYQADENNWVNES